jgi:hypothetical protein
MPKAIAPLRAGLAAAHKFIKHRIDSAAGVGWPNYRKCFDSSRFIQGRVGDFLFDARRYIFNRRRRDEPFALGRVGLLPMAARRFL